MVNAAILYHSQQPECRSHHLQQHKLVNADFELLTRVHVEDERPQPLLPGHIVSIAKVQLGESDDKNSPKPSREDPSEQKQQQQHVNNLAASQASSSAPATNEPLDDARSSSNGAG